ncbi:MAG: GEVED domain-containing protein, partial [Planctomycetota bacterium]
IRDVRATLLDNTGVDNVQVQATIDNLGEVAPGTVEVELHHSLDGEEFVRIDTQSVSVMGLDRQTISFLAPGLAGRTGENRYLVVTHYVDLDQTNQSDQALIYVQGLADLRPTGLTLSGSLVQDEAVTATFNVRNDGIATADNVQVEVFGRRLNTETLFQLASTTIETIEPLSQRTLALPLDTHGLFGANEICVVVDRDQSILELTDMNNDNCVTVTFANSADQDYGDAPFSYAVDISSNGARHAMSSTQLQLGPLLDHEPRAIPSDATSDDNSLSDDEDGITFGNVYINRRATVSVQVNGDVPGYFNGWIDFDQDGTFSTSVDQIFTDVVLAPGTHNLTFTVPAGIPTGDTYARFRISTQAGLAYLGSAPDGEVEDYSVSIAEDPSLPTKIVFVAARLDAQIELFQSNGESSGTGLLKNVGGRQSSDPHELTVVGEDLYFAATGADGEVELFRTNSTGRTARVKDLAGPISSAPHELIDYEGTLFFVATGSDMNTELYFTDGTNTGTFRVKNLSGDTSSEPEHLTMMNGLLYFAATSDTGQRELYRSDGTGPGTIRVRNLYGENVSSEPDQLTVIGDTLYFVATTEQGERELHKSDGTAGGTILVANLAPGFHSEITDLTVFNGELYFAAIGPAGNRELWKSNGTPEGTMIVSDLYGSHSSDPTELTVFDSRLFYVATLPNGQSELHVSDGMPEGTGLFVNLHGTTDASPRELTVAEDRMFFTAIGNDGERELYATLGVPDGTGRIKDLGGTLSSNPASLTAIGSEVFFSASLASGERELFKSDGTNAGTSLVKNLAGSPDPRRLVSFELREITQSRKENFSPLESAITPRRQATNPAVTHNIQDRDELIDLVLSEYK